MAVTPGTWQVYTWSYSDGSGAVGDIYDTSGDQDNGLSYTYLGGPK